MSRYGIDYYGVGYYGPDPYVTFDASPFTAKPYGHGRILLRWTNPAGKWAKLKIVRNSYGFPVTVYDGTTIKLDGVSEYLFNGQAPVSFIDTVSSTQGGYYYYSIFLYQTEVLPYSWVRAGTAIGLSVKDYKNAETLYNYLPEIYKISQPYVATSDKWDNNDLSSFLNLFGFEFDRTQTETDILNYRYNFEKVNGVAIPTMLNQFGVPYEPEIGLQQGRILLRDAVDLAQRKGSRRGLIDFVKDYTGWGVPEPLGTEPNPSVEGVQTSHNIMLSYNDSSFEEDNGHWASQDVSATISNPQVKDIKKLSLTSNVGTLTIGAHNYEPYNRVYIKNTPLPLFNSPATAVQITAVTDTTISFALTGSDVSLTDGWNLSTSAYGQVVPAPAPYDEPDMPALFPNKQKGIMAIKNSSSSSGTITVSCGEDDPITKGIPVTSGLYYTFSVYAGKGTGTRRYVTAKIKWYNRFGVYISTSSGSQVYNDTTTFSDTYKPYVSAIAPSAAYYAVPVLSVASAAGSASNEWYYFDAAQFEQSSTVTTFDEARQIHLTIRASRINELKNPSFAEVAPGDISPWVIAGDASHSIDTSLPNPDEDVFAITKTSLSSNTATVTTLYPHVFKAGDSVYLTDVTGTGVTSANYNGARTITAVTLNTFSFAVTASTQSLTDTTGSVYLRGNVLKVTSAGSQVTVTSTTSTTDLMGIHYPNTDYTFSFYARATSGAAETLRARITWYDSSNNPLYAVDGALTTIDDTQWYRPYVTAEAPSNAAKADVEIIWPSVVSGDIIEIDQALFENTSYVSPYFDGSTWFGNYSSFTWEGSVPNGARSHFYKNQLAIQLRVASGILNDYMVLGSTVAIYLAQPNT